MVVFTHILQAYFTGTGAIRPLTWLNLCVYFMGYTGCAHPGYACIHTSDMTNVHLDMNDVHHVLNDATNPEIPLHGICIPACIMHSPSACMTLFISDWQVHAAYDNPLKPGRYHGNKVMKSDLTTMASGRFNNYGFGEGITTNRNNKRLSIRFLSRHWI